MFRQFAALSAVGTALVFAGCQLDPCYPGIDAHARYRVDVQELYTSQSTFMYDVNLTRYIGSDPPCTPGADGITPGAFLRLQGTGTTADKVGSCSIATADLVSGPAETMILGPSTNAVAVNQARIGDSLMYGVADVSFAGCRGAMALAVLPGNATGGILSTPVSGQPPPAVLFRYFFPTSGGCAECNDDFVIQLTKE
jgi:hypothetical protein